MPTIVHPLLAAAADAGRGAANGSAARREEDRRDSILLAQIKHHDSRALDTLVGLYGQKLARFAEGITGTPDLGDEVAQDVFVAVWEHRATLEIRESVGAYLYRAARNRALNVARRERSQYRVADDSAYHRVEVAANDAVDRLAREDLRAEVRAALADVPARCREIFLLVWVNELTYDEVAEVLGVGVRTVQNQYYRAVGALARHFEVRRPQ